MTTPSVALRMIPRPSFSLLAGLGGVAAAAVFGYESWKDHMHSPNIQWHGADQGATPPTVQVFIKEEVDQAPVLKRIWRTSTPNNFNRHNTKLSEEGQQPTV